jgi:hypothetical protein
MAINKALELTKGQLQLIKFLGAIEFPGDVSVAGDLTITGSSNIGVDETVEGQLLLDTDLSSTASAPALAFGDGDTGVYESSDDQIRFSAGGADVFRFTTSQLGAIDKAVLLNETSSSTNPVFTYGVDLDTGVGFANADQLSLIAGGVEGLRINTDSLLIPNNNVWLQQTDNSGTSYVNMFRVNTSDELEVGTTLNSGPLEFEADSGVVTAMNLPVTDASSDGDEMSMSFSVDSNPILKVKGLADGSGGINNEQLQSYGGIIRNTTTVNSASYSLNASDDILLVSYTSTGAVSLTLPSAQCVDGRAIVIKDSGGTAGTNNITIGTENAETIDGSATKVISSNYGSVKLISNGANWFVI